MRIDRSNPWLCISEGEQQPNFRLFCLPYAGGTAEMFYSWQPYLPAEIQLCPIQLPGRSFRIHETPCDELDNLISKLCEVISGLDSLPFAVFGHSLGGLLGFELLRRLPTQVSQHAKLFFTSARYAPRADIKIKVIHNLDEQVFINELVQLGGMTQNVVANKQLMTMLLPALRADFKLSETYRYQASSKLCCPIIGFAGVYDDLVPVSSMQAWRNETASDFKLHQFSGDHFFIRPFQKEVLRLISHYIREQDICGM